MNKYKNTPEFEQDIEWKIRTTKEYDLQDIKSGLAYYEKLVNTTDDKADDTKFNKYYANRILSTKYDDLKISEINVLEDFIKKICSLKDSNGEKNFDDYKLVDLYEEIGFFEWIEEDKDSFNLDEADAEDFLDDYKYEDNNVAEFIEAYQGKSVESLFAVYIVLCNQYAKEIDDKLARCIIENIDYVEFAKKKKDEFEPEFEPEYEDDSANDSANDRFVEFDKHFVELKWLDNKKGEPIDYSFETDMKFIGEAGFGKTTQMKNVYKKLIEEIIAGNIKKLPIWVSLKYLTEEDTLEKIVSEKLEEYSDSFEKLKDKIALFLDGYNEIITSSNLKSEVANKIDSWHKSKTENGKMFIAMTDRVEKNNPPCLMKKVNCYKYDGLNDTDIENYIAKNVEDDNKENVKQFFVNASWAKKELIPSKMNMYIELVCDDEEPEDERDFYQKYLEYIFDREADKKKETRCETLKLMLSDFAEELKNGEDSMEKKDIIKFWESKYQSTTLEMAVEYFNLATGMRILDRVEDTNFYKFKYPQYREIIKGMI